MQGNEMYKVITIELNNKIIQILCSKYHMKELNDNNP